MMRARCFTAILICTTYVSQQAFAVVAPNLSQRCEALRENANTVESVAPYGVQKHDLFSVSIPRPQRGSPEEAPPLGAEIEIVRCLPPGRLVQVAKGRIQAAEQFHYVAQVEVPETLFKNAEILNNKSLVARRNLYWQPMKGDKVRVLNPRVTQARRAWPKFEYSLNEIFESRPGDPGPLMSLSDTGRQKLVQSFESLADFEGRFLIEAQTFVSELDRNQPTASRYRAGAVASYLSRVFELDPDLFVVRGLPVSPQIKRIQEVPVQGTLSLRPLPRPPSQARLMRR